MTTLKLYYATNRRHIGNRWTPRSYGNKFSDDGMENLRFGVVALEADDEHISTFLNAEMKDCGVGNGEGLSGYLAKCAKSATIQAYEESISKNTAEAAQENVKLGSKAMFADVQADMQAVSDVVLYIHGFNVNWYDAVGSALSLQTMLRSKGDRNQNVVVVLFTWPSDGLALPWVSYKSDRSEARGAGAAHPVLLHNKVHQVDCTPVVHGLVEHSYYLVGNVLSDIRSSIDGWDQNDARRQRRQSGMQDNVWVMK